MWVLPFDGEIKMYIIREVQIYQTRHVTHLLFDK